MFDLKQLFTCDGLLVDKNGDSVPDGVRVHFSGVSTSCMPLGLIDFYARLGLETTALSLPFTKNSTDDDWHIQLLIDESLGNRGTVETGNRTLYIRGGNEKSLSDLLRWLAASWPHELPESLASKEIAGLEWTKEKFRTDFFNEEQSNWVEVVPIQVPAAPVTSLGGLQNLWTVKGFFQGGRVDLNSKLNVGFNFEKDDLNPEILLSAADLAARMGLNSTGIQFPLTEKTKRELEFVIRVDDSLSSEVTWEENKVYFSGGKDSVVKALDYFSKAKRFEEGGTFALWEHALRHQELEEEPLIYERNWHDDGEKEDLFHILEGKKADHVVVYISEPAEIRKELAKKIRVETGAGDVRVRSAFKPGFFWIEEEILPFLRDTTIGKIHIVCQKNEKGLELPNRWIQELYPIDEVLSQQLSLNTDRIEFSLGETDGFYQFTAFDMDGNCVFRESLDVPTVEMDYINEKDKVYPTTGSVQLYQDGKLIYEQKNPTDRERFWLFFKNEVLPEIVKLLPLDEDGRGKEAPFFSRLLVEASMSEEERKLGIEEERISSLEALHEDIYFNVLDFFEHLGEKRAGKRWDAPGGVHPFMHVQQGAKPSASVKLYGFTPREKKVVVTQQLKFESGSEEPVSCVVQQSSGEEILVEQWTSVPLPELDDETRNLGSLRGVHVWLGGISYEGRAIPVLDVVKPNEEDFYSSHKLSLFKPTILIETGHHANEVSSSPAAKELIQEMIGQDLLNHINLVVIPRANPDGSHLHRLLASDNPEWKHHAARYNAVGLEFAHARYKNTIFGEGDVVPNAIHRWLPDVIIDGHGIPGHEWIQPFAGFNSPPRFPVSYSIPISFIYGITKDLNQEKYPLHRKIQDFLISGITEKINRIEVVRTKNEYWRNRYRKYGTNWVPDAFPIEEQDGLNFYHWDTKVNPASTEYISRYPEWCSADFITEAADETVYGDTLAECIMAQKAFFQGVIENTAVCEAQVKFSSNDGFIKYDRKRPLQKG